MSSLVKLQGTVRKTAASAAVEGATVDVITDSAGRLLTRPYQARDLIRTAAASLTTGTKTALATSPTGKYYDLVQIGFYNASDAATYIEILDESTSIRMIPVAAAAVTQVNLQVPHKQSATGVGWYLDMPDITGTTVTVNAEFIEES